MFLLDIRYDPKKNKIIKWIKSDESVYRHEETFYPKIYLSGIKNNIIDERQLTERLRTLPYIKDISIEEKKTWLRRNPEKVMCITMQKYIYDTASMLEKKGYHTYNVDIDPVRQYLLKENLFPTAKLKNNFDNTIIDEHQNDIDYNVPDINCRELRIISKKEIDREKGLITADDPIGNITFGDIIIDQGSESEIIQEFCSEFINEDPDLILTEGGDNFDIPYLYYRASQYGIDLQLGRDIEIDDNQINKNNLYNNGRTYFSYGRIYYKPRKYTLSGRLHIDKSSFIYREGGLLGLIDISRLTRIPLQELSRLSPGSAVTALQVNQAIYDGILVPWRRNLAENWKTAEELLIADRGALVIEPKVGIHENVYELDFASLFPNIMVNHNISPETVLCDCCSSNRVPFINYNRVRRGDTPKLIRDLQNSILLKLSEAKTADEFYLKIYDVIEILREYTRKVLDGQCNTSDLILETRISREYENYRQFNNQVAALKQFKQEGIDIIPGQTIGYVITDHKSKNYQKRVKIPQLCETAKCCSDDGNYDRYKYYQFLLRATESILLPFGYTEEKLHEIISRKVQKNLGEY